MSNQSFLNDPDALDNKTLNVYCNTLTANNISGGDIDLKNIECETLEASVSITGGTISTDDSISTTGILSGFQVQGFKNEVQTTFPKQVKAEVIAGTTGSTIISGTASKSGGGVNSDSLLVASTNEATTSTNLQGITLDASDISKEGVYFDLYVRGTQLILQPNQPVVLPDRPFVFPANYIINPNIFGSADDTSIVRCIWRPDLNGWTVAQLRP
jgi:hypothetical protein